MAETTGGAVEVLSLRPVFVVLPFCVAENGVVFSHGCTSTPSGLRFRLMETPC